MTKQVIIAKANALIDMWKVSKDSELARYALADMATNFIDTIGDYCDAEDILFSKNINDRIMCNVCGDKNDKEKTWALFRPLRNIYGKPKFLYEDYLSDDDFELIDYVDDKHEDFYFVNYGEKNPNFIEYL